MQVQASIMEKKEIGDLEVVGGNLGLNVPVVHADILLSDEDLLPQDLRSALQISVVDKNGMQEISIEEAAINPITNKLWVDGKGRSPEYVMSLLTFNLNIVGQFINRFGESGPTQFEGILYSFGGAIVLTLAISVFLIRGGIQAQRRSNTSINEERSLENAIRNAGILEMEKRVEEFKVWREKENKREDVGIDWIKEKEAIIERITRLERGQRVIRLDLEKQVNLSSSEIKKLNGKLGRISTQIADLTTRAKSHANALGRYTQRAQDANDSVSRQIHNLGN